MKKKKVTLADVLEKAMTDKKFLKALRAGPKKSKSVLAKRQLFLSAKDQNTLDTVVLPTPKPSPLPPPPPPWEPTFAVASAILTILDRRVGALEKGAKRTKAGGRPAKH